MVYVEDLVLRMTVTVLANVTVSKENVFTHVPKAELIALLIVRALDIRMLDLLNVEGRRPANEALKSSCPDRKSVV